MIGRADIEGSKSDVAMNAWPPQASYPCGNFSDTSGFKPRTENSKGSIGHAFAVRIRTGNRNQTSFYPSVPHEISVPVELVLGHLRYLLTDVPPQPNSPPDCVFNPDPRGRDGGRWVPRRSPPAARPRRRRADGRAGPGAGGRPFPVCVRALSAERGARGGPASARLNERDNVRSSGISRSDGVGAASHLFYASRVISRSRTRVKLNRVFFPR